MSDIPVDAALSATIRALVAESAVYGEHAWQRELATRWAALPVYGDIGGALLLTPDGRVLEYGWGDPAPLPATGPTWITTARIHAARRFPALRVLAPVRPPATPDCGTCEGTGHLILEGAPYPGVPCGSCLGTGWLAAPR